MTSDLLMLGTNLISLFSARHYESIKKKNLKVKKKKIHFERVEAKLGIFINFLVQSLLMKVKKDFQILLPYNLI